MDLSSIYSPFDYGFAAYAQPPLRAEEFSELTLDFHSRCFREIILIRDRLEFAREAIDARVQAKFVVDL